MAIPKKRLERIKQLEAKADAKYKRIKKRYGYEFSIDKRIASEMSAKQAREYEKYLEEYADPNSERYQAMLDEICRIQNFTSLRYHRLDDLIKSIGIKPCDICTYCFNGEE